jgi:hypothetical protein
LFLGDYADLDKCPKCSYDLYKRKKDGGDDNNADDENEPREMRGKKKKANRGAPMRVMVFLHNSSTEKMVRNTKKAQLLRWHDEGRKKLKKDGKFRHPADAAQWGNINNHFPWIDNARSIQFL